MPASDVNGLDFGNVLKRTLSGLKYYDGAAPYGGKNGADAPIAGWNVYLYVPSDAVNSTASAVTNSEGAFSFSVLDGDSYKICEENRAGYTQTEPSPAGSCYSGIATADRADLVFGNHIKIRGTKYYDTNQSGVWNNPPEVPVAGFLISAAVCKTGICNEYVGNPVTTTTGADGTWSLVLPSIPPTNNYLACESVPPNSLWAQTGPLPGATAGGATAQASKCWLGTVGAGTSPGCGLDFGNVCRVTLTGKTIGFWSNRNGQALIDGGDLTELRALNLRDANGNAFDPASAAALSTWLLSATATNMAHMLSAQLSATVLNKRNGFVNPDSQVFDPYTGQSTALLALIAEADLSLGSDGYTPAGDPNRTRQEQLKNIFDSINNSTAIQPPGACVVTYPQ
jgi:hypothetical protein